MILLLTEKEVARIIAAHYEVNIEDVQWKNEEGDFDGFSIEIEEVAILKKIERVSFKEQ